MFVFDFSISKSLCLLYYEVLEHGLVATQAKMEAAVSPHQWKSVVEALPSSSPSQTLRLTPLVSALRAARAHDAVLRMYPDLPLRFIKIHGDILVSYANKEKSFHSR